MKRFSKIVSVIVAAPAGLRHQRHVLRLHVGGEAGVGLRPARRPRCTLARRAHAQVVRALLDAHARLAELVDHGAQVGGLGSAGSRRRRRRSRRPRGRCRSRCGRGSRRAAPRAGARCRRRGSVGVPAPSIVAPMRTSRSARSATSGSQAALWITVSPSARQAAIITFSVPVTVTVSKRDLRAAQPLRRAPRRSRARPGSRRPSSARPCRCRLIGRAPIAQPPGSETRARPSRATSGPSTSTEARIVLTRS